MAQIGRRIYYELATGNIIQDTGEKSGSVIETTIDDDYALYGSLSGLVRESVGVKELAYGENAQDFKECTGYRINPTTLNVEFTYPDPANPQTPITPPKPLSQDLAETKQRLADVELQLADIITATP